jgi:uncharacterized protein (DUF58 family)
VSRAAGAALGGLALTLAAFLFDAAPLFVPGVAFALIGAAASAWVSLAAAGATVSRRLESARVVEEEPLAATVEVTRGPWGLPGAEVLDPLVEERIEVGESLSLLRGGRRASVRVVARFPRRGRRRVEPPSLIVSDGLGLARVVRLSDAPPLEVVVLPRTEPVRWSRPRLGARADAAAAGPALEPIAAAEVDGLRPYRPGAPASRIHWQALARGRGLLERRLRADGDTRPLVVLDARCVGPDEHLDAAVRAAASLTLELARRGGCGLLFPGERRPIDVQPDLGSWPRVHARLAVVNGGAGARPPALAAARLGPVIYVAAQRPRRIPAALAAGGARVAILVIPTELSARAPGSPCFEVSGCRGFVVGGGIRSRPRERVA